MSNVALRRCAGCDVDLAPLEQYWAWHHPARGQVKSWCLTCFEGHYGLDHRGTPALIPLMWVDEEGEPSADGAPTGVQAERSEP